MAAGSPLRTKASAIIAFICEYLHDVVWDPLSYALHDVRDTMVERHRVFAQRALPPVAIWTIVLTFAGHGVRNLLGWWGFGIVAALTLVVASALFVIAGRRLLLRRIPLLPATFVLWCTLSVLWSQYPLETSVASMMSIATTLGGLLIAIAFPLRELLDIFTAGFKWILSLSLALELFVEIFVGHRIPPFYMRDWPYVADSQYWVNALLFEGGPIQGFVGNRNPLAFVALLCLLCVILIWLDRREKTLSSLVWIAVCITVLALTRSATVIIASLICATVLLAALGLRLLKPPMRRYVFIVLLAMAALSVVVSFFAHEHISDWTNRSSDLSGRGLIWSRLFNLWERHPILGWGWIMYWAPWIPMFRRLVVRGDGTPTMSAHNAYIEALFQTGIIGAAILIIAVIAVSGSVIHVAYSNISRSYLTLAPMLLVCALVVQSFTESRLISEGNWVLFVAIATWLVVRVYPMRATAKEPLIAVHEGDRDAV
ncbi:O-antigen ligase family protein [Schaalia suimastitidis]|uniref:O-antigen ligase family protein n=1 Tax=Schaalia suimastitidis TaxID=121163 RepID=UPI00040D9CFB|nr:O-antigen ligase family protein [Schaalia suimastitidis]